MRPDADGIHREEWLGQQIPHAPVTAIRAAATVITSHPPADRSTPTPTLLSVEAYASRWGNWLEQRSQEAAEAEGGEEAISVDPLLAEGLGALQSAVDRALAKLEHQLTDRFAAEAAELRANIAAAEAERAEDRERHRVDAQRLCAEAAVRRNEAAAEAKRQRAESLLLHNEIAEMSAVDRLRTSRAGRWHAARVQLKLVRADLEREAKGAA
jgi:hypothetical protein